MHPLTVLSWKISITNIFFRIEIESLEYHQIVLFWHICTETCFKVNTPLYKHRSMEEATQTTT